MLEMWTWLINIKYLALASYYDEASSTSTPPQHSDDVSLWVWRIVKWNEAKKVTTRRNQVLNQLPRWKTWCRHLHKIWIFYRVIFICIRRYEQVECRLFALVVVVVANMKVIVFPDRRRASWVHSFGCRRLVGLLLLASSDGWGLDLCAHDGHVTSLAESPVVVVVVVVGLHRYTMASSRDSCYRLDDGQGERWALTQNSIVKSPIFVRFVWRYTSKNTKKHHVGRMSFPSIDTSPF